MNMCTALQTIWYTGCALGLASGSGESTYRPSFAVVAAWSCTMYELSVHASSLSARLVLVSAAQWHTPLRGYPVCVCSVGKDMSA